MKSKYIPETLVVLLIVLGVFFVNYYINNMFDLMGAK